MSTSRSTGAALDYVAHRLTCFDCTGRAMCDVARGLLDSRIEAVARKREAIRQLEEFMDRIPPGPEGRRFVRRLMESALRDVEDSA